MKNSKNANDGELSRAMELLMNGSVSKTQVEYIFPEFAEYYDQRMRKAISCIVKSQKEQQIHMDGENGIKYDDMISWLEDNCENEKEDDADFIVYHPLKNGKGEYESIPYSFYGSLTAFSEDKDLVDFLRTCFYTEEECDEWIKSQNNCYTDNTITKFKVGDWIVNNNSGGVCQVIEIRDDEYCIWPLDSEIVGYFRIIDVDNEYYLWTIQVAKDGDVLVASDDSIFIYAGSTDRHSKFYVALTKCGTFNLEGGNWEDKNSVHPATKEQRKLFFRKMNEQGYEWDTENKRLK